MARDLSAQTGIGTDSDYLNGNLVDGQTIVGEGINQDIVQFFQKLMELAGLTANGDPDNETNDYQFIEALKTVMLSREKLDDVLVFEDFEASGIASGGSQTYDISSYTSDEISAFRYGAFFMLKNPDSPGVYINVPVTVKYDSSASPTITVTIYNDSSQIALGDLVILLPNKDLY